MVFIFNWIGAGMALLAVVVLFVTDSLPLAALVLILADVPYRLKKRDVQDSLLAGLLAPHTGGHVFFVPCWAWGIILPILDRLLGSGPSAPPPAV
jgi:hypothetical protein